MKNLKQNLIVASLLVSSFAFSQVVIGGATGSAAGNTSVLLDFPTGLDKGIILPYVTEMPSSPALGTILLDATSTGGSRIKFYNANTDAGTNGWFDLSGEDGDVVDELLQQPTGIAETDSRTIIGDASSTADGVLVLESNTKAMVLPMVADVNDIKSPSPGMMVYVTGTNKRLAVYNGSVWSFWRP